MRQLTPWESWWGYHRPPHVSYETNSLGETHALLRCLKMLTLVLGTVCYQECSSIFHFIFICDYTVVLLSMERIFKIGAVLSSIFYSNLLDVEYDV